MDIDKLIDEVTREVLKCIGQLEKKPEILLITQEESRSCREILDEFSGRGVICSLELEESLLLESIDTVVLMNISNENLYKLANGASETRYLKLASEAILTGKKVILVKEEIELFSYEKSAPILYYNKILENLEFLRKCGVIIVAKKDLEGYVNSAREIPRVLQKELPREMCKEEKVHLEDCEQRPKVYEMTKRLITDRDIKEVLRTGVKAISVMPKTIITQLAKDSMSAYNISLIEQRREAL